MIDTILFDLDGTLVHHGNALMVPLFAEWGYQRSYDDIKEATALSVQHFYNHIAQAEEQGWVSELFGEFYHLVLERLSIPDEQRDRSARMQRFFDTNPVPPVFDDVLLVLAELNAARHTMGVITQRGRAGAERFLAEHGLTGFFDVLVAGDDGHGRKPGAGPFHKALALIGKPAATAVYVGDRIDDDCEGATKAGLRGAFLIDRDRVFTVEASTRDDFVHLTDLRQLLQHVSRRTPRSSVTTPGRETHDHD